MLRLTSKYRLLPIVSKNVSSCLKPSSQIRVVRSEEQCFFIPFCPSPYHRRAWGAVGASAPPRRWQDFFRRNLQWKCVSAAPRTRSTLPHQPEQESIFRTFLLGGLDLEVYLDRLLRATSKKSRQLFDQKVHPQLKCWPRLCTLQ